MELDHIALFVSGEQNLAFYERLGFHERERRIRPQNTIVFMECDGITLEVFIDRNHPPRVTEPEAMGLRHIAFRVDDFDGMAGKMDCEPVRTDSAGKRFTFCKDPDGQPIEIREK